MFNTYAEDLYQTLLTGVLGLRNRRALEAMLKRRFDDRGVLSYSPSIMFAIRYSRRFISDYWNSLYKFPPQYPRNDEVTSVSSWSLDFVYPWHKYRSLFLFESYNGYLNSYRNRYTWTNFINSRLSGMIISRLYNGNYNLDNLAQDFSFKVKPNSLGYFIKSGLGNPTSVDATLFTGSSLACFRMMSELSRIQNNKKYNSVRKSKAVSSVKAFDA